MPKHTLKRYHDISCGHRVVGHEGKCRHLHGHNYRVHFVCEPTANEYVGSEYFGGTGTHDKNGLDEIGRVIDFGEVKSRLCMWLEDNWDHKFLAWDKDFVLKSLFAIDYQPEFVELDESFVFVPFNPTAENMAQYLVDVIGLQQLEGTGIKLVSVTIEETRKCSVTYGI